MKNNKPDFNSKLKKHSLDGKDLELAVESFHKPESPKSLADEKEKEKTVRISVDVTESIHERLKMYLIKSKQFNKLGPFLAHLAEKEMNKASD
ncbi:MAG: hypothetical protein ACR2KZ_04500 [Segetibacter sp.]